MAVFEWPAVLSERAAWPLAAFRVPVMFHFGEKDTHIPLAYVDKIRAAYPQGSYHLYPAGHGFNCTERADYEAASARLAFERTIEFFHKHVG